MILPYNNLGWEERSIFLNFLIPKLPAPEEEDLSKGILERIDMDSYRVERRRMREIILEDEDAEIDPVQAGDGGGRDEIETDRLSAIIEEFNDLVGGIEWGDRDRVVQTATVDIPAAVAKDARFRNARRNSDWENARVESDKATERAVLRMVRDDTPTVQAVRRKPGLQAVAGGHGVPAGLRSDGLTSLGHWRERQPAEDPVHPPAAREHRHHARTPAARWQSWKCARSTTRSTQS